MAGSGSVEQRKKLLTVSQQIEHLKSKGVTFELCSEEEAAEYLSERTYFFKIAAYRILFEKRVGGPRDGQYANLDFGHLRALASLDRDLRYALLPLTLDVEHAAPSEVREERLRALIRYLERHRGRRHEDQCRCCDYGRPGRNRSVAPRENGQDEEPPHQADRNAHVPSR